MQIIPDRLVLREMTEEDYPALYAILSDPETMRYYPQPYDEAGTRRWIAWCRDSYAKHGFGLWAVTLDGEFIGDCGITLQNIHGNICPEIGYHIRRDHWRKGYASEAARACMDYIFEHTQFQSLYSYMKYTNEASAKTALSYGCRFVDKYEVSVNTQTLVFAITRDQWQKRQEA